ALLALWALHANALRIINHIEYVEAGRFQRMQALYLEAERHASRVLEKARELNIDSQQKVLVPVTDPDYVSAVNLYSRAMALDPRPEFSPERRLYYDQLAQLYEAAGVETAEVRTLARAFLATGNTRD